MPGPKKTEADLGVRQISFRIHYHDKAVLDKILHDDGLTFQSFCEFTTKAYMEGDRTMMRLLKERLALHQVPKTVLDRYTLSSRERQNLLDEIEVEINRSESLPVTYRKDRERGTGEKDEEAGTEEGVQGVQAGVPQKVPRAYGAPVYDVDLGAEGVHRTEDPDVHQAR